MRIIFTGLLGLLFVSNLYAQAPEDSALKTRLVKMADRLQASPTAIQNAIITKTFTNKGSGIEYMYLQQTLRGIPVYNSIKTAAFKDGKLVYTSGEWMSTKGAYLTDTTTRVEAIEAIRKAAVHLGLAKNMSHFSFLRADIGNHKKKWLFSPGRLAKREIEIEQYWAPDSLQRLHLVWNVNIDVANSPDWWNVRVDAKSGDIISKNNWTTYERNDLPATTGSYTYNNNSSRYLAPSPPTLQAAHLIMQYRFRLKTRT